MSMKNSNDTIGNRTRDLPACSAVPQPTALPRAPGRENGKRIYKGKPMLTRPLGRPKNRWEDDIRYGMKKLKIKNWISCIQDRNKRKLYVEKVKIFKEWSCSAWRRNRETSCYRFSKLFGIFVVKYSQKRSLYFPDCPKNSNRSLKIFITTCNFIARKSNIFYDRPVTTIEIY